MSRSQNETPLLRKATQSIINLTRVENELQRLTAEAQAREFIVDALMARMQNHGVQTTFETEKYGIVGDKGELEGNLAALTIQQEKYEDDVYSEVSKKAALLISDIVYAMSTRISTYYDPKTHIDKMAYYMMDQLKQNNTQVSIQGDLFNSRLLSIQETLQLQNLLKGCSLTDCDILWFRISRIGPTNENTSTNSSTDSLPGRAPTIAGNTLLPLDTQANAIPTNDGSNTVYKFRGRGTTLHTNMDDVRSKLVVCVCLPRYEQTHTNPSQDQPQNHDGLQALCGVTVGEIEYASETLDFVKNAVEKKAVDFKVVSISTGDDVTISLRGSKILLIRQVPSSYDSDSSDSPHIDDITTEYDISSKPLVRLYIGDLHNFTLALGNDRYVLRAPSLTHRDCIAATIRAAWSSFKSAQKNGCQLQ